MMDLKLLSAYLALGAGAVMPIVWGSQGALKYPKDKALVKTKTTDDSDDDDEEEEQESESLSSEDALWFPVMGSAVLFGLYMLFRVFSKEYINYLLTAYFALLGTGALVKVFDAAIKSVPYFKTASWNQRFRVKLWKIKKETIWVMSFDYITLASLAMAVVFTAYYVWTKNWIASNVYGEAFATSAIQLLDLDDFKTGMFLLSGLFVYDIFWVFGTEVMVSVAKNFDAPVKLLFPRDLFADELKFAMLGLGDIVIPGIFVALCLRFDQHMSKDKVNFKRPYFNACMTAYVIGLAVTVFVMHNFGAAQPALLYLSPACILSVLLTALVRGELKDVFAYKSDSSIKKAAKEIKDKAAKNK